MEFWIFVYVSIIVLYVIIRLIVDIIQTRNILRKEKNIKKQLLYNVKNFIRYYNSKNTNNNTYFSKTKKLYSISLANKFCIISIDFTELELFYYDKVTNRVFTINKEALSKKILETLFNQLCKQFNFKTEFEDVLLIIKNIFSKVEENQIEISINKAYQKGIIGITCNEMSIAELIELPGINIGKANKIKKHLQTKKFNFLDQFIKYAKISKEDAKEIQEIFNHDIRYIPKNL